MSEHDWHFLNSWSLPRPYIPDRHAYLIICWRIYSSSETSIHVLGGQRIVGRVTGSSTDSLSVLSVSQPRRSTRPNESYFWSRWNCRSTHFMLFEKCHLGIFCTSILWNVRSCVSCCGKYIMQKDRSGECSGRTFIPLSCLEAVWLIRFPVCFFTFMTVPKQRIIWTD